jgi:peptide/nickel transport system permease protein
MTDINLNKVTPDEAANVVSMKKRSQAGDIAKRFLKDKKAVFGLIVIIIFVYLALFPGTVAHIQPDKQVLAEQYQAPGSAHWFGTDNYGRDLFSRVIFGTRWSLLVGLVAVSISCIVGIGLGCIAGYYGGLVDNGLMRFIDIMLSIPGIMLAISIIAMLGAGFSKLIIALGIGAIPGYARIIRASVLSIKDQEFIEASRSIGASDARIIFKHILPNCMAPIIVQATLSIASTILDAAALSFIGLGIAPPTPEWGALVSSGKNYIITAPHISTYPVIFIFATVTAFNLVADGLRDVLDPRMSEL